VMRLQLRGFFSVSLLISSFACAQIKIDAPEEASHVQTVTSVEYRRHLESLKGLVQACEKSSAECDAKKIGDDERVEGGGFQTRWSWLRDVVSGAHDAAQPGRAEALREASARLNEDVASAAEASSRAGEGFQPARKKVDEVLARPEFRTVSEQSYIERAIARFWQWVDEVFGGVSEFGKRSPWLVPVLEWGFLTLSVAGLLAWVLRTMQRQRLAVRIESSASAEVWQKESDNWAELARAEAARQDWRAAVHCLYWATIVMMEGRKLWRQNRARTPREYVSLLEPGSRMQQALRRLTQLFERIWYGLRPAAESDYASALVLFEELRGA
jgi:Domain of unknown function (DUF4129)